MLLNVASDQGLHCLFTECSIKILIKMKNTIQQLLKRKWTGPIDRGWKQYLVGLGNLKFYSTDTLPKNFQNFVFSLYLVQPM